MCCRQDRDNLLTPLFIAIVQTGRYEGVSEFLQVFGSYRELSFEIVWGWKNLVKLKCGLKYSWRAFSTEFDEGCQVAKTAGDLWWDWQDQIQLFRICFHWIAENLCHPTPDSLQAFKHWLDWNSQVCFERRVQPSVTGTGVTGHVVFLNDLKRKGPIVDPWGTPREIQLDDKERHYQRLKISGDVLWSSCIFLKLCK